MTRRGGPLGRAGRAVAAALHDRRARRAAAAVTAAYLLVYLLAVGDVTISPANDLARFVTLPSLQVAPDWTAKLLERRGTFAYEPVLALYPANHVTVFVAPLDLAMGLLLGALAGLNLAVALRARRASRACRLRGLAGLLGTLPALLTGVTCCVPTLALALGAQLTVTLLVVSDWLFPLALAVTTISLLWNAQQLPTPPERPASRRRKGGADAAVSGRPTAPCRWSRRAPHPAPKPGWPILHDHAAQPHRNGDGPARPVPARVGWPCGRNATPAARTHRWAVCWLTP
jgi:hypothetical protein